jgi:PAS domain S-box-containing protein
MTLPLETDLALARAGRSSGLLRVFASGFDSQQEPSDQADVASYRAFLEALGVAVYTTDARGRITFFNDAAVRFWGRRPEIGEEWCGSLHLFHVDGTPMPHDACPMAIALNERRAVRGEEAIVERPDGSRLRFMPFPTPLVDGDGVLIGAVNVLIDVSPQRDAEAIAREREQALEASNAVRDEFLSLVSHELRTPVTTIFGNATLLDRRRDDLDPATRQAMISDIAVEAGRLHDTVENLLNLTKLESGAELDLEPQVLQRLVNQSVQTFRRRNTGREVRLTMPRHPLLVSADPTYIDLLVGNLLNNAYKYSPAYEPIELDLTTDDVDATLVVRDRGIGIDPEAAGALFEPFYRTPQAKSRAGGLGIGLALCRRIARALNGRIWAEAREGGGAEFSVAIPLVEAVPLE